MTLSRHERPLIHADRAMRVRADVGHAVAENQTALWALRIFPSALDRWRHALWKVGLGWIVCRLHSGAPLGLVAAVSLSRHEGGSDYAASR